jgi:hypothetical protein
MLLTSQAKQSKANRLAVVSFLHSASTSGCLPVSVHPNARQRKPLPAFTSLRFLWTRHHPPPLALLAPVRQGVLIREQARKRQSHVCFRARARGIRPAASAASFLSHVITKSKGNIMIRRASMRAWRHYFSGVRVCVGELYTVMIRANHRR